MTAADDTTHGVFITVTEGGTIIKRTPAFPDGPRQYNQLHQLVGGYFALCFHMASATPGRSLQFYCDDDGLRKDLPYNLTIGPNDIVGPVVIVAAEGPEIFGLTDAEAAYVANMVRAGGG